MRTNHWPFLLLVFCLSQKGFGQHVAIPVNTLEEQAIERYILTDTSRSFLSLRPYKFYETSESVAIPPLNMKSGFGSTVYPVFQLSAGGSFTNDKAIFDAGAGLALEQSVGKKLLFYADFFAGVTRLPAYATSITAFTHVVPGRGYNYGNETDQTFTGSGFIEYKPSDIFAFELGYGKNFIGNGYHSLFLSDVPASYPYGKITTSIWNLQYINLYSAFQDIQNSDGNWNRFRYKFASTHYLNWAISKKVNIGFFETIVWQAKDSLSNRGFDVQYLNPVIFYRPVEYSIGSPDNALMGIDLSVKTGKNSLLYGQVLLDEFLLKELLNQTGWWANKWGVQVGAKIYDAFSIDGFMVQVEGNIVRPFTYTHGSVLQNYTHFNEPLAHPLGTNFYQSLLRVGYSRHQWNIEYKIIYAKYGRDAEGENLGGNLFTSYKNPSLIYGNIVAQGTTQDLFQMSATVAFNFEKAPGMSAFLQAVSRSEFHNTTTRDYHILRIGIRSLLYRSGMDYLSDLE